MDTVLFVNATIVFSENLFLVFWVIVHTDTHTHTHTHRHRDTHQDTHGNEYSIVAVDKLQL